MRRPSGQVPAEHGSWAFLGVPLATALVVAPSGPGAWLATAAVVAFLARVPLKRSVKAGRILPADGPLLVLEALAGGGAAALALRGLSLPAASAAALSLVPAAGALAADFRGGARTPFAEALAMVAPCILGGAVALAGGAALSKACLLAAASFLSLAAPVTYLRSLLARQKGRPDASLAPAVAVHGAACAAAVGLHAAGGIGWLWPAWMGALALRAAAEPVLFRRLPDTRSLGIREVAVCVVSAAVLAASLRFPPPFGP